MGKVSKKHSSIDYFKLTKVRPWQKLTLSFLTPPELAFWTNIYRRNLSRWIPFGRSCSTEKESASRWIRKMEQKAEFAIHLVHESPRKKLLSESQNERNPFYFFLFRSRTEGLVMTSPLPHRERRPVGKQKTLCKLELEKKKKVSDWLLKSGSSRPFLSHEGAKASSKIDAYSFSLRWLARIIPRAGL